MAKVIKDQSSPGNPKALPEAPHQEIDVPKTALDESVKECADRKRNFNDAGSLHEGG